MISGSLENSCVIYLPPKHKITLIEIAIVKAITKAERVPFEYVYIDELHSFVQQRL